MISMKQILMTKLINSKSEKTDAALTFLSENQIMLIYSVSMSEAGHLEVRRNWLTEASVILFLVSENQDDCDHFH